MNKFHATTPIIQSQCNFGSSNLGVKNSESAASLTDRGNLFNLLRKKSSEDIGSDKVDSGCSLQQFSSRINNLNGIAANNTSISFLSKIRGEIEPQSSLYGILPNRQATSISFLNRNGGMDADNEVYRGPASFLSGTKGFDKEDSIWIPHRIVRVVCLLFLE
ncbi:hypothetical protein HHI36_019437 [Cryptolaemus montrouzieri]|uniref:Uncharacterized protein n=1 Tax=Cryptolaemus montrouzieri TaxID=559131 RepID=A0ABD2P2X5_9CUCU